MTPVTVCLTNLPVISDTVMMKFTFDEVVLMGSLESVISREREGAT